MKKRKKRTNKKFTSFKDLFLYFIFGITLFLSINILLVFFNICYLPPNTTGECVIARSLLSFDYLFAFLLGYTIISVGVTSLYLLDGFKLKIKKYRIIGIINLILNPFIIVAVLNFLGGIR